LSDARATLGEQARASLLRYRDEIARWGARTNLVGSLVPGAIDAQIDECLVVSPLLPAGARVVDLGSGAGLPGIPLAIARPDVAFSLVDRRERRIHFLSYINRLIDLDCAVIRRGLEQGPPGAPFDLALMRAVAPLARSRALAGPWLGPLGSLWIWTREHVASGEPIADLGARGHVLRVSCTSVSRGTHARD
jgi:16S rRNA (guanine527-N7)-methyltransferase